MPFTRDEKYALAYIILKLQMQSHIDVTFGFVGSLVTLLGPR